MSKTAQYQAYSLATRTVPKTRQIVMLYDGAIRFLKQAQAAIAERRIEDRFRLLTRASDIMVGLQNSIDFEQGGEVAHTLHKFYTNQSMRILSINFKPAEAQAVFDSVLEDLKQMRDIWDQIDRNLNAKPEGAPDMAQVAASTPVQPSGITLSA